MGLFDSSLGFLGLDDTIGDLTGANAADATARATTESLAFQQQGLDELIRQFGISQENLQPFIGAGQDALGPLQQGSTVEGLDQMLAQIMGTDTFGTLRDERERSTTGLLGSSGLTRSGAGLQEIANVPTDLALQLESMLYGRQGNLATMGQNAAVGAGSLGAQGASGINQSLTNMGNTTSQGILGQQQAQAAGTQNLMNLGLLAASYFSDPSLKDNLEIVGKVGPLDLYEWDWKPEFKDTLVDKCPQIGFLSTDVRKHYPEYVATFGGFDVIRYDLLLEELKNG